MDADGYMGATACIVVTSFLPYYDRTQDWTALAWWVHDHIPNYAGMTFYPKLAAFNISWSENPDRGKSIYSYVENPHTGRRGYLTHKGADDFEGSHEKFYREYLKTLNIA